MKAKLPARHRVGVSSKCMRVTLALAVASAATLFTIPQTAHAREHSDYYPGTWARQSKGEHWTLVSVGDGDYAIRNNHTGYYLGADRAGRLVLWPRASYGERWSCVGVEGGAFGFQNRMTGRYLGSHRNGQLVLWPRLSRGERWTINGTAIRNVMTQRFLAIISR